MVWVIKVIGNITIQYSAYKFLLAFNSNYVPILHHFWDVARYWLKIDDFNLPPPLCSVHIRTLTSLMRRTHWVGKNPSWPLSRPWETTQMWIQPHHTDRLTEMSQKHNSNLASNWYRHPAAHVDLPWLAITNNKQGVALTGWNSTGPPWTVTMEL